MNAIKVLNYEGTEYMLRALMFYAFKDDAQLAEDFYKVFVAGITEDVLVYVGNKNVRIVADSLPTSEVEVFESFVQSMDILLEQNK